MILLRFLLAFVLILTVPAIAFWPSQEWTRPTITNLTSYAALSVALVSAYFTLRSLRRFPGERSALSVVPVCAVAFGGVLVALWFFRLPYSVFYLSAGLVLTLSYLFAESHLAARRTLHLHYIDVSGMDVLPTSNNVRWHKLAQPMLPENEKVRAVITNLHAPDLGAEWQKFLAHCTLCGIPVYNIRQIEESLTGRVRIRHMYENDLGSLLPSPVYMFIKQILDMALVLISLPLTLPLMLATALAIRMESRGKILFVQNRVGQGGREFKIYKFRSMSVDSEKDGAKLAQVGDSRITRVGQFIRKTRLDELPQFFNILKGEMSLIGPRPEQKYFVAQFEQVIPFYSYRHIVKPGLSGWAQVTQGYAGNEDETQVKIEHDFYYIKHFSFALDVFILFKTIKTIFTGFGAR
ncbi:MAG: sugar transferase [Alysiella sp.]|uniref:sugar transferase n=1 Tax=Alysiella sp. TaxID=1872483 RepID=UPI0026DC35EE|nr:sugar transferase [Alysiella sp.]MDO4433502.1 sugar transferase [Alysiella sp.]